MTRRRVLACAFTCSPPGTPGFTGGEDVLGWNLLQQIARFHDVWAITHSEDRASIEEVLDKHPVNGLHFIYIGLPSWLKHLLKFQGGHQLYYYVWQIKAYLAARRLQRSHGFDLFHHITYANDWMVNFIGAFLPIPYIRGPGGGAHRTPKGLEQEYTLGGRLWERVRSWGQWLFRHDPLFLKGQNRAHAILVCNRDSYEKISANWSHKVHLFPVSGVDAKELSLPLLTKQKDRDFKVLTAGSLIRVKGFGLAIKAFSLLTDKYPNSRLTIAGEGPEEPRLRRLIHQSQIDDRVEFLGAVPRPELMSIMASSDALLFPSLRDGGGTVVVEAMSVGKPVVCLDISGPGLHVSESSGIKVTPSTPTETAQNLAAALERLYLDEDLRVSLGEAARERAREYYSWDRLGERLMEIYQSVFGQ